MGCGASADKGKNPETGLHLFISKTRNAGVTKEFLVAMPEKRRKPFVEGYGTHTDDVEYILTNWNKIGHTHDEQTKQIAGVSYRVRLDIPQQDDPEGKEARKTEITQRQKEYVWHKPVHNGIPQPPYVENIPSSEDVGAEHKLEIYTELKTKKASLHLNKALDLVHNKVLEITGQKEDPFKDWADLYRMSTVPRVAKDWKSDAQFAQQRFNGINPTLIRRVDVDGDRALPVEKFPVTDELMSGIFPEGETLKSLAEKKRLFICDCEELEGIPHPEDRYLTAPIALFFIDNEKRIMPAAIQLYQKPSATNPIFTPNPEHTNPNIWLAAKTHFQVADGVLHEVVGHYCATHAYVEVIYISMMRNLSVWHPISELIRPHFWFTLVIQDKARKGLINADGPIARLMACGNEGMNTLLAKSYSSWRFSRFDLPKRLERRGVDNAEDIPNLYYRDDGVRLYRIIEEYVGNLVDDFYPKKELIEGDHELHAWIKELVGDLGLKDLPIDEKYQTMMEASQIKTFLTGIIWTSTAGHSMVNNGQWDYWGFIPNLPATFRFKPPTDPKQEVTEVELAKCMPEYEETADQISLVHVLSSKPTKTIGQYTPSFMSGRPNVLPMVKQFQEQLEQLSKDIRQRNENLEFPYPYLDPACVSNTVDI